MLSPDQIESLKLEIKSITSIAGNIVDGIDPAIAPLVAIGQAVVNLTPELIDEIQNLISKKEPTDADSAKLVEDATKLADPNPDSV